MVVAPSTSRCRLPGGQARSSGDELVEAVPAVGRRRCSGMLSPQMSPSRCAGTAPLHRHRHAPWSGGGLQLLALSGGGAHPDLHVAAPFVPNALSPDPPVRAPAWL